METRAAVELRRPDPTSDFDEVLAVVQACDRAVYGDSDWTADELREEWDDLGWIGDLAVRAPWRRRGLGQALLLHSFRLFADAGKQRAGLGVDNATGALARYERGLRIVRKSNTWERAQ
jgi:GNAT superfamily N-acetyltransferase